MNTRVPTPIVILIAILSLGILGKCSEQKNTNTSQTPQPVVQQQTPSPQPTPDPFPQAVKAAISAAQLTQTAKTDQEWKTIISNWQTAIEMMQAVPPTSNNHQTAQQKIPEYQKNLNYAKNRQQLTRKPRIQRGEQLVKAMDGAYQAAGQLTPTPVVRIILPKTQWDKLSDSDQVNITLYAESLIPIVRANPQKYAEISPEAPAYNLIVSKTSTICDECWAIITGQRNSQGVLTIDETEVQGDSPWETADPCCRGGRGSDFREARKYK